jgi:signal transduction histidine kinase/ligand-binding sensor domain-containing protein/DNA-binding response OmpR family regulator
VVIILSLLAFFAVPSLAQYDDLEFDHIAVKDGLPMNTVREILQDRYGYLWFGTQMGLVKYDGYSMKVYRPDQNDPNSLSFYQIFALYEDHLGTLWVGTGWPDGRGGLNEFDRSNDNFIRYIHNSQDSNSLSNNLVDCIYEDSKKRLWIGTADGLNLMDRQTKKFLRYYIKVDSTDSESPLINCIIENPINGNILLGTYGSGLWNLDIQKNQIERFQIQDFVNDQSIFSIVKSFYQGENGIIYISFPKGFGRLDVKNGQFKYTKLFTEESDLWGTISQSIIKDSQGLYWFCFPGTGLFTYNPDNGRTQNYRYDSQNPKSISSDVLTAIYQDRTGIIWLGSHGGGLNKLDLDQTRIKKFLHNPNNPNSISNNVVSSVYMDSNHILWVGTISSLGKFDRVKSTFKHYKFTHNGVTSDIIFSIYEDKYGELWFRADPLGLVRFNPVTEAYKVYAHNPNDSLSISNNTVFDICEDHSGTLWIATKGGGLNKFDRITNTFISYRHNPDDKNSISNDEVHSLLVDREGTLWIGTDEGSLNRYNHLEDNFTPFNDTTYIITKAQSIPTIYEDKKGNLWVGSFTEGLYLFDREKEIFTKGYSEREGLSHITVRSTIEDETGNLWIGTENGLSKFNPTAEEFKNYYVEDGLAGNRFIIGCVTKSPSGELIFGSGEGLIIFHPDSIKDNPFLPQVSITNISLMDDQEEEIEYEGYISDVKEITLSNDQNGLRFDYVGIHYSQPERNQYKYKLENYNENWIDAGDQRIATYTNLDPGDYFFKVIASNKDGVWNEKGASIKIIILPPWWATTWAYFIYTLIVLSIIYFTWKLQLKRIRIKHDYEMSRFEAEKMHEVDEMKSRFFANISHEFRTPLTLIFGPAKDILEKTEDPLTKKNVGIIKRNASRLYGLVNQLLDLSKLEAGKMTLEAREQNIIPLLKGLVLSFTSLAERKKITLKFNTIEEKLNVFVDKDKMEKIVNNLLSNAFKFTTEGGKIDFTVEKMLNEIEIRISDNGIGIPDERINKIFNRFYQVDGRQTRETEGTGIGLALTKELVELHKGKTFVESKEGKGTTFTVFLPLGREHLKPEEIVEKEIQVVKSETKVEMELIPELDNRKEKKEIDVFLETEKPLLLIVEDNSDVRSYIISHLENDYRIQEAIDGEDGMNQAIKHIPDLIISDVMMPKMDGFELCNKLKADEKTSHIPIIMLTAKATSQDKIEGYQTGADDYIMKPFDASVLRARIKNLIEIRRKLQEKFSSDEFVIPGELSSIDERFLNKVLNVINEHISEEDFSIELLSKESAMSKEQIYKKIKALTGKSPSLFLRSIRLVRAKKMIKENKSTISEISYLVGFSSPAYFTKCFKEEFGNSPSDLLS